MPGAERAADQRAGRKPSLGDAGPPGRTPPQASLVDGAHLVDGHLFSFHGCGDRQWERQARRRLERRPVIRTSDPKVEVVKDALFVPAASTPTRRTGTSEEGRLAGLLGPDGQPVTLANLYRGVQVASARARPAAQAPVVEVDEQVVYLGWLLDHHYGHFLLESLARTWLLDQVEPTVRVVFHHRNPGQPKPPPWVERLLEAFGVPWERVLLPQVPTRFREIIVPEALLDISYSAHERAADPYQSVARRIAGDLTPSSTQPVYLSRRLLPSSKRALIGEAELEDVLRENGFLVVHPETMTFEDQVRLVNAHSDIFSSTSSVAHTIMFSLHHPRLHLMTSAAFQPTTYSLCSQLVAAPTAFVRCLNTGQRTAEEKARWLPEVVAMPLLVDYLTHVGLLKSRVRTALAGRNPALREAYDEVWFYTSVTATRRGEGLPDSVEREAEDYARRSWPVSLALTELYLRRRDRARFTGMIQQFAGLVAREFDLERLARYRSDVEWVLDQSIRGVRPELARTLMEVAWDRFRLELKTQSPATGELDEQQSAVMGTTGARHP